MDKALALAKDKRVKIMYTDEIAAWWTARRLCSVRLDGDGAEADLKVPVVLKFPKKTTCLIGGKEIVSVKKTIAGRDVWLAAVPAGKHNVKFKEK